MAKSFPIKITRRCDKSGAAPATPCFAGGSRAGENGTRQRAGCRFRVVAPSTHRRAGTGGVAGIQRNLLHSLHLRRPANLKACSVTLADMRWRWRPRWKPFLAAKRAVCSFVLRILAGWWGIRISSTRRCWRGWRLSFTKDCRPGRTAVCGGKSSRNIRLAGCSQRRPPFAC